MCSVGSLVKGHIPPHSIIFPDDYIALWNMVGSGATPARDAAANYGGGTATVHRQRMRNVTSKRDRETLLRNVPSKRF